MRRVDGTSAVYGRRIEYGWRCGGVVSEECGVWSHHSLVLAAVLLHCYCRVCEGPCCGRVGRVDKCCYVMMWYCCGLCSMAVGLTV